MSKPTYIIGIDEVGRGPLAGPVGVGAACVPTGFDWTQLPGVTDSKQLTAAKREVVYENARRLQAAGQLRFEVSMVSASVIDRIGIVAAINRAMDRALKRLERPSVFDVATNHAQTNLSVNQKVGGNTAMRKSGRQNLPVNGKVLPAECFVALDGGLHAPARYLHQETIIKGDALEPTIGLASIVAKVTRDRYMERRALRASYQPYDFATHKGYGTKAHCAAIARFGLSDLHRVSYCGNIILL